MNATIKNCLSDIVQHTSGLGIIDTVKVTGDDKSTIVEGMADDRSVIMRANFHTPVPEFIGKFGLPNLPNLSVLLKIPEYAENATISMLEQERNGESVPVGIRFDNEAGDFHNDYRLMSSEVVSEKLKSVKMLNVKWDVQIEPSMTSIQRLKFQTQANSSETVFVAKTEQSDLKFYFGDHSTHTGNFVFAANVAGKLTTAWAWPIQQVASILNLPGTPKMNFSNAGVAEIVVDSGLAVYQYLLPAQRK